VSGSRDGERTDHVLWIDTAFNGGLAIPWKQKSWKRFQEPNDIHMSFGSWNFFCLALHFPELVGR